MGWRAVPSVLSACLLAFPTSPKPPDWAKSASAWGPSPAARHRRCRPAPPFAPTASQFGPELPHPRPRQLAEAALPCPRPSATCGCLGLPGQLLFGSRHSPRIHLVGWPRAAVAAPPPRPFPVAALQGTANGLLIVSTPATAARAAYSLVLGVSLWNRRPVARSTSVHRRRRRARWRSRCNKERRVGR